MNVKIVYYVATSGHRWGKGLTLAAAMDAAGVRNLKTTYRKGDVETSVYFAVFKPETTPEELENLKNCIVGDSFWGNPMFYENENEPDYKVDQEMVKRLFLGWAQDFESFTASKKKEVSE